MHLPAMAGEICDGVAYIELQGSVGKYFFQVGGPAMTAQATVIVHYPVMKRQGSKNIHRQLSALFIGKIAYNTFGNNKRSLAFTAQFGKKPSSFLVIGEV